MLTSLLRTGNRAESRAPRHQMSFKLAFLLLVGLLAAKVSFGQTIKLSVTKIYALDNGAASAAVKLNFQFNSFPAATKTGADSIFQFLSVQGDNANFELSGDSTNWFSNSTGAVAALPLARPAGGAAAGPYVLRFFARLKAGSFTAGNTGVCNLTLKYAPNAAGQGAISRFAVTKPTAGTGTTLLTAALGGSSKVSGALQLSFQVYSSATPSGFTAGNLVVMKTGDGINSSLTQPAFFVEIPKLGTPKFGTGGSVAVNRPLPFVKGMYGTNNFPCMVLSSSTTSGFLNLSPTSKFLSAVGISTVAGDSGGIIDANNYAVYKTVFNTDYNAVPNTTTRIQALNGTSGSNARAAVTADGRNFWISGTSGAATAYPGRTNYVSGIVYAPLGNDPTPTGPATYANDHAVNIQTASANMRVINLYGSQLYCSSGGAVGVGVLTVGTGTPITPVAGTGTTLITPTLSNPNGYYFARATGANPGSSCRVYITDGANIVKGYFNSSTGLITTFGNVVTAPANVLGVYAEQNSVTATSFDVYFNTATTVYRVTDVFGDQAAATTISSATLTASGTSTSVSPINPPTNAILYTIAATDGFLHGIALAPVFVATPSINHTAQAVSTTGLPQGTTAALYQLKLDVTNAAAALSTIKFKTSAGSNFTTADITAFKLYFSNSAPVGTNYGSLIGTVTGVAGASQNISFAGLASTILQNNSGYVTLVADVSSCASVGTLCGISGFAPLSDVTYNDAAAVRNPASTLAASSNFAVTSNPPGDVTNFTVTNSGVTLTVNWTVPSCITQVVVVASPAAITGTPTGTYTGNANYAAAPAFTGGGKVVYAGGGNSVVISGLTIGTPYNIKVFTYRTSNTTYSAGVSGSGTPSLTTYYSCSGGTITGASTGTATWATSASCLVTTAQTFGPTTNMVIQNGHNITLATLTLNVYNLTVNAGGALAANSTGVNNFVAMYGPSLVNDGVIGGDALGNLDDTRQLGVDLFGTNLSVSGGGNTNIGAFIAFTGSPSTVNLAINSNVRFTRSDGAGSLISVTNPSGAVFNATIANGVTVTAAATNSVLSLDGVAGAGLTQSYGTITVNGTVTGLNAFYAKNNNTVGGSTNLVVNSGGAFYVNDLYADLTGGAGSAVTVNAGGFLGVSNTFHPQSGSGVGAGITLLNNAGRSAVIDVVPSGVTLGSLTAQIAVPAAGWHFFGSPITSQTFSSWSGLGARLSPLNNANTFYYNEPDSTSTYINGSHVNVNSWWVPTAGNGGVAAYGLTTPPGRGFRTYVTNSNTTLSVTGVPASAAAANINVPITATSTAGSPKPYPGPVGGLGGWNLIANPFQAVIDWDAVVADNGGYGAGVTEGTIYIWRQASSGYVSYKNGTAVGTGASKYILPGQGFMVSTSASSNVAFKETHKVITTSGTFLRKASVANSQLHIILSDGTHEDESVFGFRDGATLEYDGAYDAYKLSGSVLEVSTGTPAGSNLVINYIAQPADAVVIPMQTRVTGAGSFKLLFTGLEGFDPSVALLLHDKFLGTYTSVFSTQEYNFAVSSNPASITDRFELVTGPASVTGLPKGITTKVIVYPNPANGSFSVSANGIKGETATVTVLSSDGRVVYKTQAPVVNGAINAPVAAQVPAGVYVVRVLSAGQATTTKLVVE